MRLLLLLNIISIDIVQVCYSIFMPTEYIFPFQLFQNPQYLIVIVVSAVLFLLFAIISNTLKSKSFRWFGTGFMFWWFYAIVFVVAVNWPLIAAILWNIFYFILFLSWFSISSKQTKLKSTFHLFMERNYFYVEYLWDHVRRYLFQYKYRGECVQNYFK